MLNKLKIDLLATSLAKAVSTIPVGTVFALVELILFAKNKEF